MTSALLRWVKGGLMGGVEGGEAWVLRIDGDAVAFRSSIPSPPGSRIDAEFVGERAGRLRMKVHGSKRQDDGSFVLEGRLIDGNRELRERLASLMENGDGAAVTPATKT